LSWRDFLFCFHAVHSAVLKHRPEQPAALQAPSISTLLQLFQHTRCLFLAANYCYSALLFIGERTILF
jgi:hypothetical protein